jgi:hypothetical protein
LLFLGCTVCKTIFVVTLTLIYVKNFFISNSREFTLTKFHTFSREFTNFHTYHEIYFMDFLKKSFVLKTIHVTSSYRKNKRFVVKNPARGYFERCLPSIPVKKKISWKSLNIFVNSREKVWNFVNLAAL